MVCKKLPLFSGEVWWEHTHTLKKQTKKTTKRDIVFSERFGYTERSRHPLFFFFSLRLEYKYQRLLGRESTNCTQTGYIHLRRTYYACLYTQLRKRHRKREKDMKPAPLTLDTLQSKTADFCFCFFPPTKINRSSCVFFFVSFALAGKTVKLDSIKTRRSLCGP